VVLPQNAAAIAYKINFVDEQQPKTNANRNAYLENLILEAKDFLNESSFVLLINGNKSLFKTSNSMDTHNNSLSKFAYTLVGGDGVYYTDQTEKIKLHQLEAYGTTVLLKTALDAQNWELTDETKTIGAFVCYKAILEQVNYEIIVWYAPDVYLRFGPAGYGNLPGLILELSVTNNLISYLYYATHINFNPEILPEIEKPVKGKLVTQKQLDQMGEKAKENLKKMRN